MDTVTIHTRKVGDTFISRWTYGARSGEVLQVHISEPYAHARAELQALAYLLIHEKLIGASNCDNPLTFNVSNPQTLTAIAQVALIPELRVASRAIRTRFGDVNLVISSELPDLLPGASYIKLSPNVVLNWVLFLAGHFVIITEHSVLQAQHRHAFRNRRYAFRFVQRWAKRQLMPALLPPAVIAEKVSRYEDPGLIVCDNTGWHGVIVNETLVTMFYR